MNGKPQQNGEGKARAGGRKFLVVVDETPECRVALRFAARRALNTGGYVVLLYVIPHADFQHWMAVEELMREEALLEADEVIGGLVAEVRTAIGIDPEVVIREGNHKECILGVIAEDPAIGVLVLGAGTDEEGPGPLVSSFAVQTVGTSKIPVTIVPGNLSPLEIDELT